MHVAAHYGQTEFVREMLTRVPATLKSEAPSNPLFSFKDLTQEVSSGTTDCVVWGGVVCSSLVAGFVVGVTLITITANRITVVQKCTYRLDNSRPG